MKVLILFVIAGCTASTECLAQKTPLPRFEDFPVEERFAGEPAPVIIVGPHARMFRTMLRVQAAEGPNFAGRYTVASWGCGSGCKGLAIVDAQTGKVSYLPKTLFILRAPFQEEESVQFRFDSRYWREAKVAERGFKDASRKNPRTAVRPKKSINESATARYRVGSYKWLGGWRPKAFRVGTRLYLGCVKWKRFAMLRLEALEKASNRRI